MPDSTVSTVFDALPNGGTAAIVTIDNPPVNAGSAKVRQDLLDAFEALSKATDLKGVVLTGANGNFVAGSDIKEFGSEPLAPHLPEVIAAIEAFDKPVIAAIDGAALGGGYELALGCDGRIASPQSMVGLPEVTLGLIPGAGGTFRLPRLVGVAKTIELITGGIRVKSAEALDLGMVDAISNHNPVADALKYIADGAEKNLLRQRTLPQPDEENVATAEKAALKAARGAIAVMAAIDAIKSADAAADIALTAERNTSLHLRRQPQAQALQHLFFAERAAAKPPAGSQAKKIQKVGIVGGGRMGTGIALAFAGHGFTTVLVEPIAEVVESARAAISSQASYMLKRGRITATEQLTGNISFGAIPDLANCDLIIEAITEDMTAKKALFAEIDQVVSKDAILASNTSYLDLNEMGGAVSDPSRFAGLHFFNPANIMKLVEVIRADKTAPDVIATLLRLCRKLGKVPVIARVGDGFIGNRIFAAYRAQCEFLLEEGCLPHDVDDAMRAFGMAMGPFEVFDLAGLDIAWANRQRLAATRPDNARYVSIPDQLCEQGRFGRKTGKGWYDYQSGKAQPDPEVHELVLAASHEKGIERRAFTHEEIQRRLLSAIINEACHVLDERVAERPADVDLTLVYGYGFPALKGGPLHWAAHLPQDDISAGIDELIAASGPTAQAAPNISAVLDASKRP